MATELEKVSFHSNPKERQCQRMLKLLHNCTHRTLQQSNAQNSPSWASTVRKPRTSRYSIWIRKGRRTTDQIAYIIWIIVKAREFQENIYLCFIDYAKVFDCVHHNKLWKILKEMGVPDLLTCFLRNLYAHQETTVRTRHGKVDWVQIGMEYIKVVCCHPAYLTYIQIQFSSASQSCPTFCNPMNHSMPGLPVHHQLSEFTQIHVH